MIFYGNMSTPPDIGCAVRPDGTLKDASEIEWHFDKDDETPLTAPTPSAPTLHEIHPFFSG